MATRRQARTVGARNTRENRGRNITGALFCLAVQHHWEENGVGAPTRATGAGIWHTIDRCDNCGSDRVLGVDVHGVVHTRSYAYTQEFRDAQSAVGEIGELYTSKQHYRAAYLQWRRKAAREAAEGRTTNGNGTQRGKVKV